ncbi:hypothetical protein JCM8547_000607 [Rhodosporidiobolus lusitaniae]
MIGQMIAAVGLPGLVTRGLLGLSGPVGPVIAQFESFPLWPILDKVLGFIHMPIDVEMWITTVTFFFSLLLCQLTLYLSPLVTLDGVWAVIYREVYRAYWLCWSRKSRQRRRIGHLQRMINEFLAAEYAAEVRRQLHPLIDHLAEETSGGRRFFVDVLSLPTAELLGVATRCREQMESLTGTDELSSRKRLLLAQIATYLVEQVDKRNPTSSPRTFILQLFHLLASAVFRYFLPFPRLKHLRQPFSLRAFLPFLRTLPGYALYSAIFHHCAVSLGAIGALSESTKEVFDTLLSAVSSFARMTLSSGSFPLGVEEAKQVVLSTFRAIGDDPTNLARAECRAQEAILEELFGWKEREDARRLRREQQRWEEEE